MKVTTVTFGRTVNVGDFSNFRLEATAEVGDIHDARVIALALESYVDELCQMRVERLRHPGRRGGMDAGELAWDVPEVQK